MKKRKTKFILKGFNVNNIIPDRKDIERARSCTSEARAKAQIEAITDPQKLMRRAIAFMQYSEYGQDPELWLDRAERIGMSEEEINQFGDILDSAVNNDDGDEDTESSNLDASYIKEYSDFLFDMTIRVAKAWDKYSYSSATWYDFGTDGGSYSDSSNKMYFWGNFYLYEPFFSKLVNKEGTDEERAMRVDCMEYAIDHLDRKAIVDEINRQLQEVKNKSIFLTTSKKVNWNGRVIIQDVVVFKPRIRSGWNKFYKERVRQINARLYGREANLRELNQKGMVFLEKGFDDYIDSCWEAFEEFKSATLEETDEIYAQGEDVRLVQDYESCEQSSRNFEKL